MILRSFRSAIFLTDWQVIERRLEAATMGDFCVALYNPASRKRTGHLRRL